MRCIHFDLVFRFILPSIDTGEDSEDSNGQADESVPKIYAHKLRNGEKADNI